jgi:capsular exopolysaccharide synthesis family protein
MRRPLAEGVPLGEIVPRSFTNDPGLVLLNDPLSPEAERFRRLASQLDVAVPNREAAPTIITVTSAVPDEGKTTTALNLALALAERKDRSTLLIDADLRRPSIGSYLTPKPTMGLSEVLTGELSAEHALLRIKNAQLSVLPSGKETGRPLELLRSEYLEALFKDLARRFDHIVLDTPPTVPFADASVINARGDGALLVVGVRKASKPLLERAFQSLEASRLLGVVLNGVRVTPVDRYYYRYDDYNPERYTEGRRGRRKGKRR